MLESFKRFLSSKGKVREWCQNVIRQYIVGVIQTIKEKITGLKFFMLFSRTYTVHATSFDPACSLDPSYINFEIPVH